ncbi:AT DNA binding protein [Paecilomyces variotii No. 5]|uniref:AT DNA binding protein n=1 Tax=Byssochlamys spectabilis (strain No. 5 / NBRC 109023) TaxID=1356009 RepID=V5I4I7_BYSSN|nr:AT DNA binding protein [Paecilomyces variotii No. 5]
MPPRKRKSEATATAVEDGPKRTRRSLRGAAKADLSEGIGSVQKGLVLLDRFPLNGNLETEATTSKSDDGLSGSQSKPSSKPKAEKKTTQKTNTERDVESNNRSYWLMKAEPDSRLVKGIDVKFSIDDLEAAGEPEPWDGVRNFVVGMMEIVKEHSVDESAFDPSHPYFDPKSSREKPKWDVVHVEFRRKFNRLVSLNELKEHGKSGGPLENLQMLKQSRLSVSAVSAEEWRFIMGLVEKEAATS